jgi:hypothetical protein
MLKCKMIHSYPREYHELYDSFKGGSTIREWINAVEKMGRRVLDTTPDMNLFQLKEELPDDWEAIFIDNQFQASGPKNPKALKVMRTIGATWVLDKQYWVMEPAQLAEYLEKEVLYKFKGDMLEVLSEIFFTIFQSDEAVGIRDYTPVELADDYGVDAVGVNVNGHKVAIQVKYRSNPADSIPYADIARTFTSAVCQLQMLDVVHHPHTIYLFTSADGVSGAYEKVLGRKSVVIARKTIATKIDNNKNFWRMANEMIVKTLNA